MLEKIIVGFGIYVFVMFTLTGGNVGIQGERLYENEETVNKETAIESDGGDQQMKHEIVTVLEIKDNEIVVRNYFNEEYVISDTNKCDIDFIKGMKIGVSYNEKNRIGENRYQLSIIAITEEGDGHIAPVER